MIPIRTGPADPVGPLAPRLPVAPVTPLGPVFTSVVNVTPVGQRTPRFNGWALVL